MNDSINHDMINRLVYRGHDQDHPNVLDYVNKRVEKIQEIKYQAECPFCHPCTDENADHVTQKLLAILNRNEDKPFGVTYSSYSRQYVARSINDKGIDVRFDDELVYLGFGHWKKNTKEAK